MNKNPITFLKKHRTPPLTSEEGSRMFGRIARDLGFERAPVPETVPTTPLHLWYRPAFAFALGLVLVLSSSYTVKAANAAAPGDLLYPLDLTLEKVAVVVTPASRREHLYYRYAQERIDEFEAQRSTGENPTETPAQTRAREQYVVEYLDNIENKLSPEDNTRVRQRFAAATSIVESTQTKEQTRTPEETTEPPAEEAAPTPQQKTQERARTYIEYTPREEANTEITTPRETEPPKVPDSETVRKGQEDAAVEDTTVPEQTEAEPENETNTQKRSSDTNGDSTSGSGSTSGSSGGSSSGSGSSGNGSGGKR